ncbi:ORF58 [White spot syndrome virus]|uniref:Wsv077 n=7 Tax=White spot syndrome virus TaxID=342409 RepID=Q77J86_WSSVS
MALQEKDITIGNVSAALRELMYSPTHMQHHDKLNTFLDRNVESSSEEKIRQIVDKIRSQTTSDISETVNNVTTNGTAFSLFEDTLEGMVKKNIGDNLQSGDFIDGRKKLNDMKSLATGAILSRQRDFVAESITGTKDWLKAIMGCGIIRYTVFVNNLARSTLDNDDDKAATYYNTPIYGGYCKMAIKDYEIPDSYSKVEAEHTVEGRKMTFNIKWRGDTINNLITIIPSVTGYLASISEDADVQAPLLLNCNNCFIEADMSSLYMDEKKTEASFTLNLPEIEGADANAVYEICIVVV